MYDPITDVSGIRAGQFSYFEALIGRTDVLCEEGALAMADMWGSATGTRQIDALSLVHLLDLIYGFSSWEETPSV